MLYNEEVALLFQHSAVESAKFIDRELLISYNNNVNA
jgi:hypothetical protein